MEAPYGMLNGRAATLEEWVVDTCRLKNERQIVGGPEHTSEPDCASCVLLDHFIDTKKGLRQTNRWELAEFGVARIIFRDHSGVVKVDGALDDSRVNVCDCRYCWTFRQFVVFKMWANLESGENVQRQIMSMVQEAMEEAESSPLPGQYL